MIGILFLFITVSLRGQIQDLDTDQWGTYFVTSFIRNSPGAEYMVIVTTREVSHVIITDHGSGYTNFVSIGANKSHVEVFNETVIPMSSLEVTESKAISIQSSVKVSVYGFSNFMRSSDGFLVLPVVTLGTEYLAINYDQGFPQILVAAVENETIVDIELTSPNICHYNSTFQLFDSGEVFTFEMNEFDLLPVYCTRDCTGMKITANKPVAALSGNLCVKIPTTSVCDHITEMLTPTSEFGTQFIIVSPIGQDYVSLFRVLALENETTIFLGNANFTIDEYKHITFGAPVGVNQWVNTTKPVLVAQYMTGRTAATQSENYTGDGYMVLIPPVDRYPTSYVIDTSFLRDDVISYVITILEWDAISGHYSYTINEISGIHTHSSTNSMGVIIYGVDFREGYAYLAGLKLTSFSGQEACKNKPCKNGGWCLELSVGYKCRCLKGFSGTHCGLAGLTIQVEVSSKINTVTPNTTDLKTMALTPTLSILSTILDITSSTATLLVSSSSSPSSSSSSSPTTTTSQTGKLSDFILNAASFLSPTKSFTGFQTISDPLVELSSSIMDSYGFSTGNEGYHTESLTTVSSDLNVFENSYSTVFKIPETGIFEASELMNDQTLSQLFPTDLETGQFFTLETGHLNMMSLATSQTEQDSLTPRVTVEQTDYLGRSQNVLGSETRTSAISTPKPNETFLTTKRCNGHACQCPCRCSTYYNHSDTESYIKNNMDWLAVDKNSVSKTYYQKNSAKNRQESERDLGIVSVLFVVMITFVVIVLDVTSYFKNELNISTEKEAGHKPF